MTRRLPALTAVALLFALLLVAWARIPLHLWPGEHPVIDVDRDFTAAQQARSAAFHDAVRPPAYASFFLGLGVSALLGLTPLGAGLMRWVGRLVRGQWAAQTALGAALLVVIGRLVTLPLDLRTEALDRDYGLSTQTWGGYLSDVATSTGVGIALTVLAGLLAIGLARRLPRTWWAWGAGTVAALVVVGSFLYPVLVQPLFTSTTPLPAGALRDQLLALARTEGVPAADVQVADASRRTTELNAYVTGFGATRHIVVYDTLLRQSSPAEVRVIVAHELGHAKQDDVLTGTVLGALGGAAALCLLALLLTWPPLLARAGASGPGDPRVLPLALAVVALGAFLVSPGVDLLSRHIEARADRHALEATRDPTAFIASFQRLGVTNLSNLRPGPFGTLFFADHPSTPDRIAYARAWQADHP